jgi:signal transduction histidine kinase
LTTLLLVVLCAYSVRRRSVPGALPFAAGCVFAGLWAAGSAPELAAADPTTKIFWVKFQAAWQLPATTAVTCFVLEYTRPGRYLTRRNVVLLSIISLLVLLSIVTDNLHHLFWRDFQFEGEVVPVRGPLNWGAVSLGYVLGVINLVGLSWLFVRSPQHRWPVAVILSAQIGARVVYAVDAANIVRTAVPLDVISLAYLFAAYAVALFAFRIFDPIPLARRMVIEQMRDGVLVLDLEGRVASLNPAAEGVLQMPARLVRGHLLRDLLPAHPELAEDSQKGTLEDFEISLGSAPQTRSYAAAVSPLKDWRGLAMGRLVLLHDVTAERRAQAETLQRQWAEATLQERELLGQELHDGLAQALGFLSLQAQAARVQLRSGQKAAADESLKRLGEVALEVQGDARELIGNLLSVSLPSESFCDTLRGAVSRFEAQTGLPVRLEIDADAEGACTPLELPPAASVQLLRIVQEAMANVRKHAGSPNKIEVALQADSEQILLTIADDGDGFAPSAVGHSDTHFGLQVMRQRAARIGGEIHVRSALGEGTCVEVCAPLSAARDSSVSSKLTVETVTATTERAVVSRNGSLYAG